MAPNPTIVGSRQSGNSKPIVKNPEPMPPEIVAQEKARALLAAYAAEKAIAEEASRPSPPPESDEDRATREQVERTGELAEARGLRLSGGKGYNDWQLVIDNPVIIGERFTVTPSGGMALDAVERFLHETQPRAVFDAMLAREADARARVEPPRGSFRYGDVMNRADRARMREKSQAESAEWDWLRAWQSGPEAD